MLTYTARMLTFFVREFLSSIQYILFIGIIIIVNSCVPSKSIDFQILKPGKIRIGNNYKNVFIHCEFCNQEEIITELDPQSQIKATTSLNFVFALKESLQKSPVFANAKIQAISTADLLENLKDYTSRFKNNDLFIVLDSVYLRDSIMRLKVYRGYDYNYQCIIYKFGCKIYQQKTIKLIDHYLLQDTTFCPAGFLELVGMGDDSIIRDIFWNTGIKAGARYAHYLAPYWIDQSRIFYYGYSPVFKRAYMEIQKDNLDSALTILKAYKTKDSHKTQIARTLLNLGVVYELRGEIEKALEIADSSYAIKKNKITKVFIDNLKIRKIDQIALDWQLLD